MSSLIKSFITSIALILCVAVSSHAQTNNNEFEIAKFRELASRAEEVVSNDQASTGALEILRSDLVVYRSVALDEQVARGRRVQTVREQIVALGEKPEDGLVESEVIAARRMELESQLKEAQAPLIVAQEAYGRSEGLIKEIDDIIRARKKTALLQLDRTPLNPVLWPTAIGAVTKYISDIKKEVAVQWNSKTQKQVRRQNWPITLVFFIVGLTLMLPVTRWAARSLDRKQDNNQAPLQDISRIFVSLALFVLPMIGLFCIVIAIFFAEVFGFRGDLLMRSVPVMGLCFFGANWLARNFPQGKIYNPVLAEEKSGLVLGGQRTIMALGVVMALYYLIDGFDKGAGWSTDTRSVIRFPIIIMLGYLLFRIGRKISKYRSFTHVEENQANLSGRVLALLNGACYVAGIGGPLLAVFGYSNAGSSLVFSMVLTLALIATIFFAYILLVRLVTSTVINRKSKTQEEQTAGGLYKVALAFALICASLPVFALIWGARISDISNLWFRINEGIALGDTRISISDFLIFILIFFIGYTITRLLQSALRTVVLPNTRIESGAQNALVTGFGYIGIFLAALIAIMFTGLDLSSLAIVAGALSVGIGFGLQAIVSNFVSGIILLIERPVKIGDWVEVGGNSGYIRDISVRSTSIDTFDRATVIVPNADLIAGTVTNWTHDNMHGRVKAPVGVAYGTDVERVKEILLSIAEDHPMCLKNPKPWVVFMELGTSSLNFELRAIIRDVNYVMDTKSDMNYEIVKRFAAEGIEIPFAQSEVTIKNISEIASSAPKPQRKPRAKPKT